MITHSITYTRRPRRQYGNTAMYVTAFTHRVESNPNQMYAAREEHFGDAVYSESIVNSGLPHPMRPAHIVRAVVWPIAHSRRRVPMIALMY